MVRVSSATLPGTEPLTIDEPLDEVMVAGISRFALAGTCSSRRSSETPSGHATMRARMHTPRALKPNRERLAHDHRGRRSAVRRPTDSS